MSATPQTPAATPNPTQVILEKIEALRAEVEQSKAKIDEISAGAADARRSPFGGAPHARRGEDPLSSRGFQIARAIGARGNKLDPAQAKVEVDLCARIQKEYVDRGFYAKEVANSLVFPLSSTMIFETDAGLEKFAAEVGEVMRAGVAGADPDEMAWVLGKAYGRTKTLGWQQAGGLGDLVGPPVFGEPIELLRNQEVFMRLGAQMLPFPPSGRITYPRFTGATTGYWIGTGASGRSATLSEPATSDLVLQVKKLGVRSRIPNELFRFPTVSVEQIIRADMMKTAALTLDSTLLTGVGTALSPKGITKYSGIQSHTVRTVTADGNVIAPEDLLEMVGKVEEKNVTFGGWVGRPLLYAAIANRRADAVTAGDAKGQFLFNMLREFQPGAADVTNNMVGQLEGYPFVKSNQVPNTVEKGAASNLTWLLGGDFTKFMIALSGVMEIAISGHGDTNFPEDQTEFRLIFWADGAPRYEEAFIWANELKVQ